LGICYERRFDLPQALSAYEKVVQLGKPVVGPDSVNLALLRIPLRLARLSRMMAENPGADGRYTSAISYYRDLATKWPDTQTGLYAMTHLAASYADQRSWRKAVDVLENVLRSYPRSDQAPQVVMAIGNIYVNALRLPRRGLQIYQRLLENYPDFEGVGQVHLAIAAALLRMGKSEDALARFRWILDNFASDVPLSARAQLGIARAYEVHREWERALSEYRWLADNYPLTLEGIYAPLYVAQWYDRHGQERLAQVEYQAAVQRYSSLAQKYPRSRLALLAQQYLAVAYARLEKWRSALSMLGAIREQNAESPAAIASYLMSASIYEQLGDYARAIQTYAAIVERYPNHPVTKEVRDRIPELERKLQGEAARHRPVAVALRRPVNVGGVALRLSWSESPDHEFSEYKLLRATRPGVDTSATVVASIDDPSIVVFEDREVEPGKVYYYRIFTFDQGGAFAGSNEVKGRAVPSEPPRAVRLEVKEVDYSSASLQWSASSAPNFAYYKIFRSRRPGVSVASEMVRFFTDPSMTSFRDERLQQKVTYYYRVFVVDQSGRYAASNEVRVTIPGNLPPSPVRLRAQYRQQIGAIELEWTASSDEDFSMYRIYRSESLPVTASGVPLQFVSDKLRTKWEDRTARPDKTYYYKVLVVDLGGLTAESNEVEVRVRN